MKLHNVQLLVSRVTCISGWGGGGSAGNFRYLQTRVDGHVYLFEAKENEVEVKGCPLRLHHAWVKHNPDIYNI